jgi:hypothetical protein
MHNKTTNISANTKDIDITKEVDDAMDVVQNRKRREQFKTVTTERKRTIHWG